MIRTIRRLSFPAKLLATFILIVLLTSLSGYYFISRSVDRAFFDYAVGRSSQQERVVVDLLQLLYLRVGSMDALHEILVQQNANLPTVIVNPDHVVTYAPADMQQVQVGRRLAADLVSKGFRFETPDARVWTFLPTRFLVGIELEGEYLRRSRTALWLAGLIASLVAILLSLLLVRSLTVPIRTLDTAARRVAEGQFTARVDLSSSDELGRLAETFNDMAASLAVNEEVKKRMIADISHELRTPITTVRTTLEGLRDGLLSPTQETLSALHDKILLTTRLVQDLHQLALVDAGRLSMEKAPVCVASILDGILETIGVQLEDEEIDLVRDIEPGLPLVTADAHRVEQILLNLLSNAIRHTPSRGTITVRAVVQGGDVQVTVRDSGPGLTERDLRHVFERFYRGDISRGGDAGAGLGLSIAKALVEAQGGRIWAENTKEGGACIGFALPLR